MNPVGHAAEVDEEPLDLLGHIRFIQLRRQGYNFDAIHQDNIEEKMKVLIQKANALRSRLLEKQQENRLWNHERIDEIGAIDIYDAARFQHGNITQTIEPVRGVVNKIENAVNLGNQELASKEVMTVILQKDLQSLTQQLHKGKNKYYSFQGPLEQFGDKLPTYISNQGMK